MVKLHVPHLLELLLDLEINSGGNIRVRSGLMHRSHPLDSKLGGHLAQTTGEVVNLTFDFLAIIKITKVQFQMMQKIVLSDGQSLAHAISQ